MNPFKDLIHDLQKVKSKSDVSDDLMAHLVQAAIGTHMTYFTQQSEDSNPLEAFEMTRMTILREMDQFLLNLIDEDEGEMFREDDGDDILSNSPMDDPQLRKDIERAMEAYNARMNFRKV